MSYQWDVQPTVIRVVGALKDRGFAVWFDLEAMSGSTLDVMAEAIEGACCALVCITAAYKKSASCRLEGNVLLVLLVFLLVLRDFLHDFFL